MNRKYEGIIPPLITPFAGRDTLDIDGLERLVNRVIAGGVSGIFVLGTSGEAPSLSAGDYAVKVVEYACRFAGGRVPVLVGITDTSLVESALLAQEAAKKGASAVVTSAPYLFPVQVSRNSASTLSSFFQNFLSRSCSTTCRR